MFSGSGVKGQANQLTYNDVGKHFSGVVSRVTCMVRQKAINSMQSIVLGETGLCLTLLISNYIFLLLSALWINCIYITKRSRNLSEA